MPSEAVTRIRQRIGTMGLPGVVWLVYDRTSDVDLVGFYDREEADRFAAQDPNRFVGAKPLAIRDAFQR